MTTMTITDHTIHNCAWDICDKVLTLEVIQFMDIPEPQKIQISNQMVSVLKYIVFFIEAYELLTSVETIILDKAPYVIKSWRDVRRVILRDEAEHQKREMQFDVNDTSQAESILNAIRKRT